MKTLIPTQFSTTVELWNSSFSKVTICYTPQLRAGREPELAFSYVTFLFQPADRFAKVVEHYFMPRNRWTEQHEAEWNKVMAMLPESFDIDESFMKTTIDLVL